MARIRTIKPQFFLNEELADLSAMTRLLFVGLWTQADRDGRLIDRPKRLKAEIFPYDNFDVDKGLKQLADARFIIRYKANVNVSDSVLTPEQPTAELALIQVINFCRHQKIDKANEKESDLPAPQPQDYLKAIGSLPKDGEGKGKEGKGEGDERPKNLFSNNGFYDRELAQNAEAPEAEKYRRLVEFLHTKKSDGKYQFTNVLALQNQISYRDYVELKKTEHDSKRTIKEVLESMENTRDLTKKYKDAYLTANNWLKKVFDNKAA